MSIMFAEEKLDTIADLEATLKSARAKIIVEPVNPGLWCARITTAVGVPVTLAIETNKDFVLAIRLAVRTALVEVEKLRAKGIYD